KQGTLDELRKDRSDLHLDVPLLSGDPGMHGHVLHREGKFDGQTPEFHHLAQAETDGDRPDIFRRRGKVSQNVAGIEDVPALAEEDGGDGLQVHLVGVGLAVLATDGPPLLIEHAYEVLLREVTYHDTRAELPLALAGEPRSRGREDGGRSSAKNPVTRVRRRQNDAKIRSPSPAARLNSFGAVSCGTMS